MTTATQKLAPPPRPKPARAANPIAPYSPSTGLPLRFVLLGMGCFVAGIALLVLRPDLLATYHYNQYVVAVTHLFVLGWICSVIMGAMYQLVPVALEASLHSERLARWQFLLHLVGVGGMVAMFWVWDIKHVLYFGAVFGLGALLFIYNIARTLARIPRWNVIAVGIASALCWLLLTMLLGLFLAASKHGGFSVFSAVAQMHAHAHLGVAGFFLTILTGVSYKLLPMFTLSEIQSNRRAWASILLLNAGLAGAAPAVLFESPWKFAFALVMAAGLVVYGWEIAAIVRARKRQALDWGIRYFLTALALIAPVAVLGVVLAWPSLPLTPLTGQLENVYGLLAILGIVSFAILGMLYKIVPFIVWYSRYSSEIGRNKVPSLADLYSARIQAWGYWTFVSGLAAASISAALGNASAVCWSCGLLAVSVGFFAANMGCILFHFVRPRIEPLPLKRPAVNAQAA
jgi:hypothetical protein